MKEQILAIQRMQDYIEENLSCEIKLSDLAGASLFSPWYSYRLFRDYTELTPTEYVRKLRLARAVLKLRDENCRIIDVALDFGFANADTFTRAFFREFGLNPSDYARNPIPLTLFVPYGAKYRELRREKMDMKQAQTTFVKMIHKPERLCIVKRAVHAEDYFPYQKEVRQYLIKNAAIPDDVDVLFINKSCETSINIRSHVDYMVIHTTDITTTLQALGRYRDDIDVAYIHWPQEEDEIELPEEMLEIRLFKEDIDKYIKEHNLRSPKGGLMKSPTFLKIIKDRSYEVKEGKIRGGKRYYVISKSA